MGFTSKQVEWIRERDNHRCQFPGEHRCQGQLEVHHIRPQGYCLVVHKLPEERFNVPFNALTVCQSAHQSYIHPDTNFYREQFRKGDKQAFEKMQEMRKAECEKHMRYWNDIWDEQMFTLAKQLTNAFLAKGNIFPPKKGAK